jgi:hypothetical protein
MDFQSGPWRIRWSGWKEPVNQHVALGYWYATREDDDRLRVCTTTGMYGVYRPYEVIDTSLRTDWVMVTPDTPTSQRVEIEKRALDGLLHELGRDGDDRAK